MKDHPTGKLARISVVVVVLLLASMSFEMQASAAKTQTPIKHVVIIIQENHTFFNYFGAYPGVQGGVADASCQVFSNGTCFAPYETTDPQTKGRLSHVGKAAQAAYDNGKMDGFLLANPNDQVMSYYTNATLGYYWGLASHYTLFDEFFSSYMSYSLPNHWAAIAGDAPAISIPAHNGLETNSSASELIQEASSIETLIEFAQNYSPVSVKYYDVPVKYDSLTQAIDLGNHYILNMWNPSLEKADTYTTLKSDFVNRTSIFTDLQNRRFPAVSWVIPNYQMSEHPPKNIILGQQWVESVITEITKSRYWASTAIFVMTDDWGGFYDPIAPPMLDGQQLGFRVSAMLISPYASRSIDNTQYSFESILHFIDYNWNLPLLNQRVADSNNMINAFNFSQSPLNPWLGTPLTQSQLQNVMANANQDTPDMD